MLHSKDYEVPFPKKIANRCYESVLKGLKGQDNKVLVITGATSGIGYVVAKSALLLGAKVVMLNRPSPRAMSAYTHLKKNFPKGEVHNIACDLASFSSVEAAAQAVHKLCKEGVDVLFNNAGIMAFAKEATEDGLDIQMQVNMCGHFLLTKLLMHALVQAESVRGEARIVNHTSAVARSVNAFDANYMSKNSDKWGDDGQSMLLSPGGRWLRYAQTKFANALFTACLHAKLKDCSSSIKAVAGHPGIARTLLQPRTVAHGGMSAFMESALFALCGHSEDDGACSLLLACFGEQVGSGQVVGPRYVLFGSPKVYNLERKYHNSEQQHHFWSANCKALGQDFDLSAEYSKRGE